MKPDVEKMRKVYEWCQTSDNYNQRTRYFDGGRRCFGGKVLELYYQGNPLQLHISFYAQEICKILNIDDKDYLKFTDSMLTLDKIDKIIKGYEDSLKPKHNFVVGDYVIIKEKGHLDGRRGMVSELSDRDTTLDVRVRCNANDENIWLSAKDIIYEDKSTTMLRRLDSYDLIYTSDFVKIKELLRELDQQGM